MPKGIFLNFNANGKAKDNAKASLKNAKGNFFADFVLGEPSQRGGELPDWGLLPICSKQYVGF